LNSPLRQRRSPSPPQTEAPPDVISRRRVAARSGEVTVADREQRRADRALPPFQWLLDEHGSAVLRLLIGAVGPVDAEDCFQDTMLSALRAYPRLRDASNLRGWLFAIARRKAIDSARATSKRPVPVAEPQAATAAAAPERDDELWDAVRALPDKQRRALVLRYAGDRSYGDIAGALAMSEDAARQNVHEGLKKLRRKVK
jgi:RNA polymerase sigma factor (sigma-70 family)